MTLDLSNVTAREYRESLEGMAAEGNKLADESNWCSSWMSYALQLSPHFTGERLRSQGGSPRDWRKTSRKAG